MRISYHVLEIERGRYYKINRLQLICRQGHLNIIEDEDHFFFHCQKKKKQKQKQKRIIKKANLYTKLMGNNHIQNLDLFYLLRVLCNLLPLSFKSH